MTNLPLANPPKNLRQRALANGSVRLWWEPSASARRLVFSAVPLDPDRLTWSVREADRLNAELAKTLKSGKRTDPASGAHTIEALVENFIKSSAFRRRAVKTQDSDKKQFAVLVQKWGQAAVTDFTKPIMHQWYETLLEQTSDYTAIARLRHMSMLFAHAELIGWRPEGSNPCSKLKMAVPKGRRRVVSWVEFDALVAAAQDLGLASIETAIILGMLQGQRQTDLRLAKCGAFSKKTVQLAGWASPRNVWVWQLTRSKRENEGAMIIHDDATPALEAAITAARLRLYKAHAGIVKADELETMPLIVNEGYGNADYIGARAEFRFQARWRKVRDHAVNTARQAGYRALADGLDQIQFRDLRRSFGVNSRVGGDDAADVLGNSAATDQMLSDIYMAPSFETDSRAVMAVKRPEGDTERKNA